MKNQKEQILRQNRCLNPHPEKLTCDLFGKNNFFDARDLLQVKYEMVRQVSVDHKSILPVSREFGFSRPALYKALADFKNLGLIGLLRGKPGPRQAHKIKSEVLDYIEAQKTAKPELTLPGLVAQIKQQFGIVVHKRSIQRVQSNKKKRLRP